jgi:hypothetical protein
MLQQKKVFFYMYIKCIYLSCDLFNYIIFMLRRGGITGLWKGFNNNYPCYYHHACNDYHLWLLVCVLIVAVVVDYCYQTK